MGSKLADLFWDRPAASRAAVLATAGVAAGTRVCIGVDARAGIGKGTLASAGAGTAAVVAAAIALARHVWQG